jgi:hypothetical protein
VIGITGIAGEGGIRTPGTGVSPYNGLANKPSLARLFGFNDLSRKMPLDFGLKRPCSGTTLRKCAPSRFERSVRHVLTLHSFPVCTGRSRFPWVQERHARRCEVIRVSRHNRQIKMKSCSCQQGIDRRQSFSSTGCFRSEQSPTIGDSRVNR